MDKPTAPQIQRVIDYLMNRRGNNAIPTGVSRGAFDSTIATLRDFIINEAYDSGYRNGYSDASMGISLQVARHAPDTQYAQGYRDGHQQRTEEELI